MLLLADDWPLLDDALGHLDILFVDPHGLLLHVEVVEASLAHGGFVVVLRSDLLLAVLAGLRLDFVKSQLEAEVPGIDLDHVVVHLPNSRANLLLLLGRGLVEAALGLVPSQRRILGS